MIFASFSTLEISTISYEIFVYYSIFQKKITFDEILKFVKDKQFKYLVLEREGQKPRGCRNPWVNLKENSYYNFDNN